jgi:hypothetical protein
MNTSSTHSSPNLEGLEIYKSYLASPYLSIKHSSYFQVYEELLSQYRGKPITFVEVGVLNGGSLFMWRHFFGPQARIIGLDLNPQAKKWEKGGFEIYIGSQNDPQFWENFFASVGNVDVLLDDGGHTNEQQIITTHYAVPHINDGGMVIVEDVHTSFMREFGNPSKYSFTGYVAKIIDGIHSRFPAITRSANPLINAVYAVSSYESIVAFKIDRSKCFTSSITSNNGISSAAEDFRHQDGAMGAVFKLQQLLTNKLAFLNQFPPLRAAAKGTYNSIYATHAKLKALNLKKYFY